MRVSPEAIHAEMLTADKTFYDREYEVLTFGHDTVVPFNYSIMKRSIVTQADKPIYGYRCMFLKSEGKLYKLAVTYNDDECIFGISIREVNKVKRDDLLLISAIKSKDAPLVRYTDELLANFCESPLDTQDTTANVSSLFTRIFASLFAGWVSRENDVRYIKQILNYFDGYLDEKLENEIQDCLNQIQRRTDK